MIEKILMHLGLRPAGPGTASGTWCAQPGLKLERGGVVVTLLDRAMQLLDPCAPLATALDSLYSSSDYSAALHAARAGLADMDSLPSACVFATLKADFATSYTAFVRAQSVQTRQHLMALPWSAEQQAGFDTLTRESVDKRRAIEAADTVDFETFRQAYLAPQNLQV